MLARMQAAPLQLVRTPPGLCCTAAGVHCSGQPAARAAPRLIPVREEERERERLGGERESRERERESRERARRERESAKKQRAQRAERKQRS